MTDSEPSLELGRELFVERGVDPSRATPQQLAAAHCAAEIARATLDLSQHATERLTQDPVWGLVLSALWRVQEYAEGSIATSLVSLPAAEIASRTVVEGSINVQFILSGEPKQRLHSYFCAYLQQEEDQTKKWSTEIAVLRSADEADEHCRGIAQKSKVIALQRRVVDQWFRELGVNTTKPMHWGNVFERFAAVGQAIEYRTTYAALCSQAHNDAEDLINSFVIQATGNQGALDSLRRETQAFSWFAVMLGLRHYARAAAAYWKHFDLLPDSLVQHLCSSADLLAADAAERVRGSVAG
jgi:hypothetical protein